MLELAICAAVMAVLTVTILGNVIAFRRMFAQADQLFAGRDEEPDYGAEA